MVKKAKNDSYTEALLTEIVGHCYEISTQTRADAFFDYTPHTSEISIRIYPDGWSAKSDCEYIKYKGSGSLYFNNCGHGTECLEDALKQLANLHDQYKSEMKLAEEVKT